MTLLLLIINTALITVTPLIITRSACEAENNGGCLVKAFRDVDGKVVWERSCCSEASCQEKVFNTIITIILFVVLIPL